MRTWNEAAEFAQALPVASVSAVVTVPPWDDCDTSVADIVANRGDASRLWAGLARAALPGAHVAVWAESHLNDLAGMLLRANGFELRDTIAFVREGRSGYWMLAKRDHSTTTVDAVLTHGTGAINIGVNRIGASAQRDDRALATEGDGRFPPNVMLDPGTASQMDEQAPDAGASGPASGPMFSGESRSVAMGKFNGMGDQAPSFHGDKGGASRFFPNFEGSEAEAFSASVEWVARLVAIPSEPICDPFDSAMVGAATEGATGQNA